MDKRKSIVEKVDEEIITYAYFLNFPIQECFYDDFVALDYFKACDIRELFQAKYGKYNFIDEETFTQQQFCLLNQVEFCHILQDPVAVRMDSFHRGVPNFESFDILIICSSKYKLFMEPFLYYFHTFSNNYLQNDTIVNPFLIRIHWKFTYT